MNTPPFVPDVAGFQKAFPVFITTSPDLIYRALSRAAAMISPCVWGFRFIYGVELLAAAWLTEDPMGNSTALEPGPGKKNTYWDQYVAMRLAITGGGFGVAGGVRGWFPRG